MISRILVVDDESIVRDVLTSMLKVLGYEAVDVPSGETALERLREDCARFDIALVDMHMLGISGLETVRRIRSDYPEVAILLVSGVEEEDLLEFYHDHLIDGFVHKPFRMTNLKESIDKVCFLIDARMKEDITTGVSAS
jgi:CheY-like chemotaxis protein